MSSITQYTAEKARDFFIDQAGFLAVQARAMSESMLAGATGLTELQARVEALRDEASKVADLISSRSAQLGAAVADLAREAADAEAVVEKLKREKAAGQPFVQDIVILA